MAEVQLKSNAIPSIVVRTSNVAKELMSVAENHKVSVKSLDFRLLDSQTFTRIVTNGNDDWIECSPEEINDIHVEMYLNPQFEIKQIYEIEIFSITETPTLDSLDISIAGNGTLCKIYLTIKVGSTAHFNETFEADFYELIKKKKLRANLMIGIFESIMKFNLADLIAKIRIYGDYTFEDQERFLIGEAYEPISTIDDKLILHYDKKHQAMSDEGRIDYSKRGYIVSVVENDLLIEYIKPLKGTIGRNARGEVMIPKEPIVKYEPTFTVSEKIRRDELEKSVEFRAKVGGYVTFEGGVYDIKTEMDVTEISFRSTGSIDTALDADVSINVKEKDALKDAIGTGMSVTVNVINIEGNVGAEAKVTAHKATIEGQVHSSATVIADELSINIHKGKAFGKVIHITRLEHGEVEGEKVYITQAVGGKIRAQEIVIELLGSHTKLTASKSIEIKKLQGGENIFTIDPLLNESRESLQAEDEKMVEAKKKLEAVKKELADYEKTMADNASAYEDIKKKLIHYKRNQIKAPSAYVDKYQKFQYFRQKLESLRKEHQEKSEYLTLISSHHTALQSEIFDARIINHDRWKNYNEVVFKLIDPPIDVTYFPNDGSDENVLGLYEEDGEFSIKVVGK
ncbi:MAG: FapA family protein [Sulfuricurvum sp.]|uniref:flagellar assembly protein A n=1 Tax=Sulfuricurvum sp. TaxID=2025608 RepID=UPI00260B3CCF|nr:flagellar assembly protein A [Sulfuricurvum sp.]MDD2828985.1 FapA family protein [Sulfuricurvum sp.]